MEIADCAERSWAWVMQQVHWDADGPWVSERVPDPADSPAGDVRDTLYDGMAGLALTLGEIRLTRAWTRPEALLAEAIVTRLARACRTRTEASLYLGTAGDLTAIAILDPGAGAAGLATARLAETATAAGWPSVQLAELGHPPLNDLLLGNAGVVLAAAWLGGPAADEVAAAGAEALVAAADSRAGGLDWPVAGAGYDGPRVPNYAHGTTGIATALAIAGYRLGRPALIEAAVSGAEYVLGLADVGDGGCRIPHYVPHTTEDEEPYTYGWCNGPAGTTLLLGALSQAGIDSVAGRPCADWTARCLASVSASGLPERLRPGFWDNDGRCCGTAGVADVLLDHAQRDGDQGQLAFAGLLVQALLDRAAEDPADRLLLRWQFTEHRIDPPLLDPGVGWMQGAAGISAVLFRYARIQELGLAAARQALPDNWWLGSPG
jgi:Lanthionine synthetase C-like protein